MNRSPLDRFAGHSPRLTVWIVGICMVTVSCGGAHDGKGHGGTPAIDAASESANVYVVRGVVVALPDPARPTIGFYVRHEAIDDFKGADGAIVGMEAMTMQFPLADGALLEGVEVGDKVELIYVVDWRSEAMQAVTGLRELAPETELIF